MLRFVEFLLAFFATLGILSLLWLLFGQLLFPPASSAPLYALIPVSGDAPELEHSLRQLLWLKNTRLVSLQLLLLDEGLNPAGLARVSLLLAQEPSLRLTSPDKLSEWMEKDG